MSSKSGWVSVFSNLQLPKHIKILIENYQDFFILFYKKKQLNFDIRINNQWRIIFQWDKGNPSEVEIVNYH